MLCKTERLVSEGVCKKDSENPNESKNVNSLKICVFGVLDDAVDDGQKMGCAEQGLFRVRQCIFSIR